MKLHQVTQDASRNATVVSPSKRRSRDKSRSRGRYTEYLQQLEPKTLLSAPVSFTTAGMGGGGWFGPASIAPSTGTSSELYLPTDMAEYYHSTDTGAATWTYPSVSQITSFYHSPVQFTNTANRAYAINNATGYPSWSTDGGANWTDLSSWSSAWGSVQFLYSDYSYQSNYLAAVTTNTSTNVATVYLSKNAGGTWNSVYSTPVTAGNELVLSNLFTAGGSTHPDIFIATSSAIVYTTNGGTSWTSTGTSSIPWNTTSEAASSVAIAQAGNTIRFVATTVSPSMLTYNNEFEWSSAAQKVWSATFTVGTSTSITGWGTLTLPDANQHEGFAAMARNNITTVYLAGEDTTTTPNKHQNSPSVIVSSNGGSTWSGNLFNVVNSANIATNEIYDNINGSNYSDFNFYWGGWADALSVNPLNPSQIIISSGNSAWMTTDGGSGGANTSVATADWKDITCAQSQLHVPGTNPVKGTTAYAGIGDDNTAVDSVVFGSSSDQLFVGMGDNRFIYTSNGTSTTPTWTFPESDPSHSGTEYGDFYSVARDTSSGVLLAGIGVDNRLFQDWDPNNATRDGEGGVLAFSTDGGQNWTTFTTPFGTTNPVSDVVIDPLNHNYAYALVANSTTGGVYYTSNLFGGTGGTFNGTATTWQALPGSAFPIRTLTQSFSYGGHSFTSGQTFAAHDPNDLKILSGSGATAMLAIVFDVQFDSGDTYKVPASGVFTYSMSSHAWVDETPESATTVSNNMLFYTQHITLDTVGLATTWYVSTDYTSKDSGLNDHGVWTTTNGGSTWTHYYAAADGTGDLNTTINSSDVYLSTSKGVQYSASKTSPSFSLMTQMPYYFEVSNVIVDPYSSGKTIWVATWGNGLWKGTSTLSPGMMMTQNVVLVSGSSVSTPGSVSDSSDLAGTASSPAAATSSPTVATTGQESAPVNHAPVLGAALKENDRAAGRGDSDLDDLVNDGSLLADHGLVSADVSWRLPKASGG